MPLAYRFLTLPLTTNEMPEGVSVTEAAETPSVPLDLWKA